MLCKTCGKPESEHHEYMPRIVRPPGCVCDPKTWLRAVSPVCGQFTPDHSDSERCVNCEHDKACHKAPSGAES